MPLALVILRYFAYIIAALGLWWLVVFTVFSATINAGLVYSANYGAAHINETAAALSGAAALDPGALPTAYRYAVIDAAGTVVQDNMNDGMREQAAALAQDEQSAAAGGANAASTQVSGSGGVTYAVFSLADGSTCVLASAYLPQFRDPALADALPNPQNLMLAAGCAGSVAAVALVARRAARVLARKMAPLSAAADRIAHENLDEPVGRSNVREVDEVLRAMERMRGALRESLEARWRAERQQRDQVAALAHDLKTPLTVVRANAEFVAEETRTLPAALTAACGDQVADLAAAADDAARGARQLDGYVRLLIEASRGQAAVGAPKPVTADEVARAVEKDARALAHAAGKRLTFACDPQLAGARLSADTAALARAVLNLVSNALDHAADGITLSFSPEPDRDDMSARSAPESARSAQPPAGPTDSSAHGEKDRPEAALAFLTISVTDDGPGFSPAALAHGCERFFRDDAARTGAASGAHYGLGLATAADIARAHGGAIRLANRTDAAGHICGAQATITLPLLP